MGKVTYKSSGVNYDLMDPFKKACQAASLVTIKHHFMEKKEKYFEDLYLKCALDAEKLVLKKLQEFDAKDLPEVIKNRLKSLK